MLGFVLILKLSYVAITYFSLSLRKSSVFSPPRLQEYTLETAVATITDGDASLKVDAQHLKLNLRPGSLYQFIGELHIEPTNEAILKARVGRNVDGLDLNLYHQSIQLLREFQASQIRSWTA